jgi:hypothetical protein
MIDVVLAASAGGGTLEEVISRLPYIPYGKRGIAVLVTECPALVAAGILAADLVNVNDEQFWRLAEAAFVEAGRPVAGWEFGARGNFIVRTETGWSTGNRVSHSKYDSLDGGRGIPSWR